MKIAQEGPPFADGGRLAGKGQLAAPSLKPFVDLATKAQPALSCHL
jgi:hypothetical protein